MVQVTAKDKARLGMMSHPLTPFPPATLWHLLLHYAPYVAPKDLVYTEANEPETNDLQIAERLMNVFHRMLSHESRAIPPEKRPNAGIWEMVKHEFHGELYAILAREDVDKLAAYLMNGLRSNLGYGLGPGPQVFEAMCRPGEGRDANLAIIADRLAAVAVAIGALPHENPEQGRYGMNLRMPITELVDVIEAHLSIEISRPPVAGLFGVLVGERKIVDVRVPDDVYSAFRLKVISEGNRYTRVCEIGAGFGGTAFQFSRYGTTQYTIIDLPLINLLQGFFLMKIFGGDAVKMFGEVVADRRFNILPYWEFPNRSQQFDLVFNRDSMPEMPVDRAREYLYEIAHRRAGFLSINQESGAVGGGSVQLNVHQLMRDIPDMRSMGRHPHWTRKGYVEELFLPT